jgi:hypothetical protein
LYYLLFATAGKPAFSTNKNYITLSRRDNAISPIFFGVFSYLSQRDNQVWHHLASHFFFGFTLRRPCGFIFSCASYLETIAFAQQQFGRMAGYFKLHERIRS